jgi:hypothetical protein
MARPGTNFSKWMQLRRPWRPKELVPCVGPKSHDAGKLPFKVAKAHGAQQRGDVSTERANGRAIFGA